MMLYNKPPYLPSKADGEGLTGLTNAVKNKVHRFDVNVQVSKEGM